MNDWYDSPGKDEREAQRLQQDTDRLWLEHDVILALRLIWRSWGSDPRYQMEDQQEPYREAFKLICRQLDIDFQEIV